jgi:hypothetical protein
MHKILAVVLLSFVSCAALRALAAPAATRGGANLFYYKLDGCKRDEFRFNPAYYDQQKAAIDPVLSAMYANGQRRLRISTIFEHGGKFPILDSASRQLSDQARHSIIAALQTIKRIGFQQIEVLIGLWGPNVVLNWPEWSEDYYQENWQMIMQIRPLLAASGLPYLIDLTGEAVPAANQPLLLRYTQRLWSDYSRAFGTEDTVGFSIIPNIKQDRFAQMRAIYGDRPPAAFDLHIYEDSYNKFINARHRIAQQGYGNIPWVIGEALYNDAEEADDVARAVQDTGQRLLFLLEWPMTREMPCQGGVDVAPPVDFSNYIERGF